MLSLIFFLPETASPEEKMTSMDARKLIIIGDSKIKEGKIEDAFQTYLVVNSAFPTWWVPLLKLGILMRIKENITKEAAELIAKSLEYEPDQPDSMLVLAVLLAEKGVFDQSEKLLGNVLSKDKTRFVSIKIKIGRINELKGDMAKAIETYEEIIDRFPSCMIAHSRLADIYIKNNEKEKALKELKILEKNSLFPQRIRERIKNLQK
jgi:tetratricopeptide (TPR) repeat protein